MYSEESPRESQAAKGKARKADNVAKSLIAELDKVVEECLYGWINRYYYKAMRY